MGQMATSQRSRGRAKYLIVAGLVPVLMFIVSTICVYWSIISPPRVAFPSGTVHDLGTIDEGQPVSHEFLVKNNGRRLLKIENISTSCGCTSAKAQAKSLASGETSKITVSYTGRHVPTKEVLQVLLETNDPRAPISLLVLKCSVRLKVFWYPNTISYYCEGGDENLDKKVVFKIDSSVRCDLGRIEVSSNRIAAMWEKDDHEVRCRIHMGANCPKGNWRDKVVVSMLLDGKERQIVIPVDIMVRQE